MSEKIFNGRIKQKHGTASEWSLATTFVPKDGELIVYDVDSDNPSPRFKVGNGVDKVNDLPFSDDDIWAAIAVLEELVSSSVKVTSVGGQTGDVMSPTFTTVTADKIIGAVYA